MIDVVMPTWNQADCTIECVESLKKHTLMPFRLIWVDDGSKSAERDAILKHIEKSGITYKTIFHDKNLGFTKSINDGIRECESNYLALINNDIVVTRGWLGKLAFLLDDNPNIGMVGSLASATRRVSWLGLSGEFGTRTYKSGTKDPSKKNLVRIPYDEKTRKMFKAKDSVAAEKFFNSLEPMFFRQVKNLPPVCCLLRRKMLDDVGLYNEDMIMFGSDNEFSLRVRLHPKWFKAIAVNCFIYHKGHVSVSKLPGHAASIRRNDRQKARESFAQLRKEKKEESEEKKGYAIVQ